MTSKKPEPSLNFGSVENSDQIKKLESFSVGIPKKETPPAPPVDPEVEEPSPLEKPKKEKKPKVPREKKPKAPKEPKPPRVRKPSKRKRGIQIPPILDKRRKTPLGQQTIEIAKLLKIWPQAPQSVIKEYVKDTLGVVLTRLCIREARELLKLNLPVQKEKSQEKTAVIRQVVIAQVIKYGIGGYTSKGMTSAIHKALRQFWNEETNHRMIKKIVDRVLQELLHSSPVDYPKLLEEADAKVKMLGLTIKSSQRELL